MREDLELSLMFGAICAAVAVWPGATAGLLSYGRRADDTRLVEAFRLMGCGGLLLTAVSMPLLNVFW
jgi:hypothetical protein